MLWRTELRAGAETGSTQIAGADPRADSAWAEGVAVLTAGGAEDSAEAAAGEGSGTTTLLGTRHHHQVTRNISGSSLNFFFSWYKYDIKELDLYRLRKGN